MAVPLVSIAIALAASYITYGRLAAGLVEEAHFPGIETLLVALGLFAVVTTSFALTRGRGGLGVSSPLLICIAASVTPIYGMLTALEPSHAERLAFEGAIISPWGVRCIALATLVGGLAFGAFVSGLRHAVPSASRIRALSLGAAAGAWAGLAVFVFCPSGDQVHMAIGHLLPIAALTCLAPIASHMLRP